MTLNYDEMQAFIKENIKNRTVSLDGLLPDYYDGVREFETLKTIEEKHLKNINKETFKWLLNQYIYSADSDGLTIFENELNLEIDYNMSIRDRRERLLSIVKTFERYTKVWLYRWLIDLVGKGNFEILINYNEYSLKVNLLTGPYRWLFFVQELLRKKPANIILEVEFIPETINQDLYSGNCVVSFGDKNIQVEQGISRNVNTESYLGTCVVSFGDKNLEVKGEYKKCQ